MPAVSVVVPYRNGARFIPGFVLMLQRQSFTDWRCFLVDDQSTDDGLLIAGQSVDGDDRFELLSFFGSKAFPGPAAVRNFALARVTTDQSPGRICARDPLAVASSSMKRR
jgi:glycosyltransferase involved in cell wall biosynthesis